MQITHLQFEQRTSTLQEHSFYVDRFHWRGHIGCSKGYCLDMYNSVDVKAINSQVNEQANASLQRIRGQLAYMTPSNFILTVFGIVQS